MMMEPLNKEPVEAMTPAENNAENDNGLFEFPYVVEPLFWGTGEMLVWEYASLLPEIDRERLFSDLSSGPAAPVGLERDEFHAIADDIFRLLTGEVAQGEARGYYGFFPVLPEGSSVMVLSFSAEERIRGRPVADYFRPDGDIIAFSTFTTGLDTVRIFPGGSRSGAAAAVFATVDGHLCSLVKRKINGEIRRAMGIGSSVGRSFPFTPEASGTPATLNRLAELLSIEERLGIDTGETVSSTGYSAVVRYFVHHPAAE